MRVRINRKLHARVKDLARKRGVSMADLVRDAISKAPRIDPADIGTEYINTSVQIPRELLDRVDDFAHSTFTTRTAAIQLLLAQQVSHAPENVAGE